MKIVKYYYQEIFTWESVKYSDVEKHLNNNRT